MIIAYWILLDGTVTYQWSPRLVIEWVFNTLGVRVHSVSRLPFVVGDLKTLLSEFPFVQCITMLMTSCRLPPPLISTVPFHSSELFGLWAGLLSNTSVNLQFDKLEWPVAHAWECAIEYFAFMSIEPYRVTDVRTIINIYLYIHIQFAHSHAVYVGLAQARPNNWQYWYTLILLLKKAGFS
jgi:hypothetical protein